MLEARKPLWFNTTRRSRLAVIRSTVDSRSVRFPSDPTVALRDLQPTPISLFAEMECSSSSHVDVHGLSFGGIHVLLDGPTHVAPVDIRSRGERYGRACCHSCYFPELIKCCE